MQNELKTYHILTFGCQMNLSDSERFSQYLNNLGLKETDTWKNADLVILNTCSVRQKAEDRIIGVVKNIRENSPIQPTIVLTGCMARRVWDESKNVANSVQKDKLTRENELKNLIPGLDIVVETKDFTTLGERLGFKTKFDDKPEHYLSFKPKYKSSFQAYVPISTGCNHFCTFCIVPYSRGKEVCRDASEIIREVFDLVKHGYKDITLLGQTVNRWINPQMKDMFEYNEALTKISGLNETPLHQKDLEKWRDFFKAKLNSSEYDFDNELKMPKDFLQLLQVIDQIPGEWWTTWISSHPNYMTKELISFVGQSSKNNALENKGNGHQRPYLHFALQSGSDKVLKRMNRRHTMKEFKEIVKLMKKEIPNLALSTDIIIGFIGETEEDFQLTLKAQKELEFDMIYIAEYSPRSGTAAARLPDKISPQIKAQRKEELNEILKKVAYKKNKKLIDKTLKVLIEGKDRKGYLSGRTPNNKIVRIKSDQSLIGKFVDVKITSATPWALEGIVIS
ncbi:MAG: tRNA-2-methylthio-N(6)-dimethylallyladenosine synthase [Candidatus Dojkabacteria bacterium]|nr:MAG: tRNA-2-methylthio-N(6)-dimethylallyladenosine synthase [Candidatus Dojkabacteria bacterium]